MEVLKPLKIATERLEGCGKGGHFDAIYEVIPVFEQLLSDYEIRIKQFEDIDWHATGALEDHLAINLRAAWLKANSYYHKLDESPAYYAACVLHPYYKRYCQNSWSDKPEWLAANNTAFQKLWI